MTITRDRLVARLQELRLQVEQARQQFIATSGAVADLEYLLDEDLKSEAKPQAGPKKEK